MRKISELLLLFLFLTVRSLADTISPPQNVSLVWVDDFTPVLSWAPPEHSGGNCRYVVERRTGNGHPRLHNVTSLSCGGYTVMNGGSLTFSVKAVCNGVSSEPVVLNGTYPELVRDFQCSVRSSEQTHCSWRPSSLAPELSFFYRLVDEDGTVSVEDDSVPELQECSDYRYTGDVRTGCYLRDAGYTQAIHVLFNGTLNKSLVRNTFKIDLLENVKPDALNWSVTKVGGKFNISWIPPDVGALPSWKFIISYTECNENKFRIVDGQNSTQLERVAHCPYNMTIKAIFHGKEGTPPSEEKYFDADTDPNALVYAAVIIPLVFIILVVLASVCCRKHKEYIFPDVPEPRVLLDDFSDNNNKITGHLYTPAYEEACEVSEVIEPQLGKLD